MVDLRAQRVAMNLLRPSPLQTEGFRRGTLAERMAIAGVPAVSVAVIHDHQIAWAEAWGVLEAGKGDPCTTETLFQVASISKPVTALMTLVLVEQDLLDLDTDVNRYLKRWQVPTTGEWRPRVTLRQLLSHTAGFTPAGFLGYRVGESVPSLVDVLMGNPGVNTEPAQVVGIPGLTFRYSGAGTCVVQLVLEDVTGLPFEELAQSLIFRPLGMANSTFAQPLPESRRYQAATGHRTGGLPIPGGWYVYPEQAPAGLWSTPSDLALMVLEIQRIRTGRGGTLLKREQVDQMLTPQFGTHAGLGFFIEGDGEMVRFDHSGDNDGFKAFLLAYSDQGKAAIILSNGDAGEDLNIEVLRAIASEFEWPKDPSYHWFWNDLPGAPWQPDPADLALYAGEYEVRPGLRLKVQVEDRQLALVVPGQDPVTVKPVAPGCFQAVAVNAELSFDADGQTLTAELNGTNLSARRVI